MSFADKFSIAILILSFLGQIFNRGFFAKYIKSIFFFVASVIFVSSFYYSFLIYMAWKSNPLSVLFLPPHNWFYFFYYTGSRIFAPVLLAFVFALIIKFISGYLNRRFDERFLEKEESWMFALGIFGAGYPGFIFYVPLMLISGLLISLFYAVARKGRAPFFYLWLPMAIFAILLKNQIPQSILNFFII